jgi:hypothetical protein
MKNKTLLLFLAVLLNFGVYSQSESWIFGSNQMPDNSFTTLEALPTSNSPGGYSGQSAQNAQNIVSDLNDQIRFFIVDGFIYDRNGNLISEMNATNSNIPVYGYKGQTAVIPVPGSCDEYFIVSTSRSNENVGAPLGSRSFYGRLKVKYMSNGQLDPCSGFIPFLETNGDESLMIDLADLAGAEYYSGADVGFTHYEYHKFAVTKNEGGRQYLFVSNHQKVYKFRIESSGLVYDGFFDFNQQNTSNSNYVGYEPSITGVISYERSEMEVMTTGSNFRLAVPVEASTASNSIFDGIFIFDVNPATGLFVPNSNKVIRYTYASNFSDRVELKGVEFSQNGQRIYVTHRSLASYPSTLDRFDLTSPNPTSTRQVVSANIIYKDSHIERIGNDQLIIPTETNLMVLGASSGGAIPSPSVLLGLGSYNAVSPFVGGTSSSDDFARLLQTQIDDFDYSAYLIDGIQCCIDNNIYDQYRFNATTTNQIWTGNDNPLNSNSGNIVYVRDELRIPAGVTITIQGMQIFFAPGARVVIANGVNGGQGGRLILNQTRLSGDNRCGNDMWLGVEVWGNSTTSQGTINNSTQGRLELRNNSIIEHALVGVLVSRRQSVEVELCPGFSQSLPTEDILSQYNGGIVLSTNSILRDNQKGVYIPAYANGTANNLSRFNNTQFQWNGALRNPNLPIQFQALLVSTKGVGFYGCDFQNNQPDLFEETNGQGIGIMSLTSTFFVNQQCNSIVQVGQPCPTPDKCRFENLTYGVYSIYLFNPNSFSCENSIFEDCRYGIYTNNSRNIRVTVNEFKVREAAYQTAGLTMFNSTGYKVELNHFYEHDNSEITNGDGNSYGIWVSNSGIAFNEIYRNTFRNLKIGGQTERINAVPFTTTNYPNSPFGFTSDGLVWRCNQFYDNIYRHDLTLVNGSQNYFQGSDAYVLPTTQLQAKRMAANNRFSRGIEVGSGTPYVDFLPDHDLYSFNSQSYRYVHITEMAHMKPDNYTLNNSIVVNQAGYNPIITDTTGACPSKLNSKTKIQLKNERNVTKQRIDDLMAIIDKGSTELLISYVQSWNNKNAVKEELKSASPYLSDQVLLAYINSNPPVAMLKEIVLLNSPVSENVKNALNQINMPIGTRNQINAAQTGISERTKLHSTVSYFQNEYDELFYEMERTIILDTSDVNTLDSLEQLYLEESNQRSYESMLETNVLQQDNEKYNSTRSALLNMNGSSDFISVMDHGKSYYNAMLTGNLPENVQEMIGDLNFLKNNSNRVDVSAKADAILQMIELLEDVPDFANIGASAMIMNELENAIITGSSTLVVSIYPNPSTGQVYFDYPDHEEGVLSIQLMDLSGKIVYSYNSQSESNGERVDLSAVKKGMYMARISIDGMYVETQKLLLK